MEQQDLRTLKILEEIERNQSPSQREIARKLNISLGLANSFLKRLAQKGYVKVTTIPRNRIRYILTPKGFAEKTKLTYDYIQFSYRFYRDARERLRFLFQDFVSNNVKRIIFFGVGDFAEIAYLSLQDVPIELVAVVDQKSAGRKMFDRVILNSECIKDMCFDKILITTDTDSDAVMNYLQKIGIPRNKILKLY